MTIRRICVREVDLAYAHETVRSAAQRMATRSVGTLVIVDAARKPVGILTDRDLALRVVAAGSGPESVRVEEVMTCAVHTIADYLPVEAALEAMRRHGVRRLPVIDGEGTLVGMLSFDDALAHLCQEFQAVDGILRGSSPAVLSRS